MIPLILLPGMMCDARLFGPQLDVLSATRAVHVLPITQHDSVEALASQVLAAAPERFALGGLSMGGIVAMEVVRQAPDRVAGLALMDTNPLAEAQAVKDMRGPQIQAVQNGKLQRVMQDDLKPNYTNDGPNRRAILDLCLDMAMDLGADVFVRQSHALMTR
ncbi:MAG: alpha/beta hydrolase, partial [Rhodobacteraceae bacterium]|nr:alpha/beta hydrolase [Paracoccaceae bacterium]